MRDNLNCLREFDKLKDADQPPYLIVHGTAITTNAATFPDIPNNGAAMLAAGNALLTLYALRGTSDAAMTAYLTAKAADIIKMEANYDYVDLIAQGDSEIIEKAGVKPTSGNTSRTAPPARPANLTYEFSPNAGEMGISNDVDKLSHGEIIVTYVGNSVTVEKSGTKQLRINVGEIEILVDIITGSKTHVQNLTKGTEINSAVVLFNPNGLSPIASPEPVIVPR